MNRHKENNTINQVRKKLRNNILISMNVHRKLKSVLNLSLDPIPSLSTTEYLKSTGEVSFCLDNVKLLTIQI